MCNPWSRWARPARTRERGDSRCCQRLPVSPGERDQGAVPCTASGGAQLANSPQDLAVLPCEHCSPGKRQSSRTSSGAPELSGSHRSWISACASVLSRDVGPRGQWLESWAHSTCRFIHQLWARNTLKWNQESAVTSCSPRTSSEWFYPFG